MSWLRRNAWEIICTATIFPAVVVACWNADVLRLAVGAFGPPPGVLLARWLVVGLLVVALVLWRRGPAAARHQSPWLLVVAALSVGALAATAWRDRAIRTRNVRFDSPTITIAGTIYEPAAAGPFPAVVLVHGSAPVKRGFYALWAEQIARSGVAVLVTDKRGVGGTGGQFERQNNTSRENVTLLATDVVAAVRFAATQPDIDSTRIGLFGLSQAGWVAPLAATMTPSVRFLAMITSPTVSVHEEGVWSDWRGDDERNARVSRADAERMMDTVISRGVDARPLLGTLDIPGLWLFGDDDNSIPTASSVRVLDSLRTTAGKRYASATYPAAGHLLITRSAGLLPQVEPASWTRLSEWLAATVASLPAARAPR
jgi:dienelactone hydrolase